MADDAVPLFAGFPRLKGTLPYTALAELPTPVQRLDRLEADMQVRGLYLKRDDITGTEYGGNKPRKLEFLLGEALLAKATHVLTFGAAGSNHALATAIYARKLGLEAISMLMPQPNASYVRCNLLMGYACGAELHACRAALESPATRARMIAATVRQILRHRVLDGRTPRVIPPGGSSPLGAVGYVNAGLELAGQVTAGRLVEPDVLYVACGTLGTAAGLVLGLRVAGMKTCVVGVKVTSGKYVSDESMLRLVIRTNRLLHSLDDSLPLFSWPSGRFAVRGEFCGERYAQFTGEGIAAENLAKAREGVHLDGTYTGKAFAALLADARVGRLAGRTVLFWNTLNSRDFSAIIRNVDYHNLPRSFHRYF